jgi:hypothetical protein
MDRARNSLNLAEMIDERPNNSTAQIHTSKQREGSYQTANEVGLARTEEAGFRRGYRDGFSEGFKLGNAARVTAATSDISKRALKEAADNRVLRLKGFPCSICGRASYNDELRCPRCGTLKTEAGREQPA